MTINPGLGDRKGFCRTWHLNQDLKDKEPGEGKGRKVFGGRDDMCSVQRSRGRREPLPKNC